MKLGITISLLVVFFFGLIGFVSFRGVAEAPSAATRPEKLVQQVIPASLPRLTSPSNMNEDATPHYTEAFDFFVQNHLELSTDPPKPELAAKVADLLIAAAACGRVDEGFLDARSPINSGTKPSNDEAVKAVAHATLTHAEDMAQFNEPERGKSAASAVWTLGHRAFTRNIRLDYRWQGLSIMMDALATLDGLASHDESIKQDSLWEWMNALQAIDAAWQEKYELIATLRPHIGDLANVAMNDKDKTFRVEALLKLGVVKFAAGTRGNQRHIANTLEAAAADANPIIQQAAITARDLSKDDLHKVY